MNGTHKESMTSYNFMNKGLIILHHIIGLIILISMFNTIDGIFCIDQYRYCFTTDVHTENNIVGAQTFCEEYGDGNDEFQLIEIRNEDDAEAIDVFLKSNIQFNNSRLFLDGILMQSEKWFWITSPKEYSDSKVIVEHGEDTFTYVDQNATFHSSNPHTKRGFVCQSIRSEDGCQINDQRWTFSTLMPDAENCFYFVIEPKVAWYEARMECLKLGSSDLADFESNILQRQMLFWIHQNSMVKKDGDVVTFWVGLVKDRWVWSGGPDDFDGFDMNMTNWEEGYPTRSNETQKCLYLEVDNIYNKWKNGPCQSNVYDYYSVVCVARDSTTKPSSRNRTYSTNFFKTTSIVSDTTEDGSKHHVPVGFIAAIASSTILLVLTLVILLVVIFRRKCKRILNDSTFSFHQPQILFNPFNQQITFPTSIDNQLTGNGKIDGSIPQPMVINIISDDYSSIGESHFGSFGAKGNNIDQSNQNRTIEHEFVYENEEFFNSIINQNVEDKTSVGHMRAPNGDMYALVMKK